jgi:hypothetical protein
LDQFEFASVTILTHNPFLRHERYCIKFVHSRPSCLENPVKIDSELQTWNGSKVFMCLYGRPTAARLVLASHMFEHHADKSHIHMKYSNSDNELQLFELNKVVTYSQDYIEPIGRMIKHMPLEIAPKTNYVTWGYDWAHESVLTAKYQDIFVDIVGETFVDGCTFFPTEKIVRAMLLKKPFIVYGSCNFMEYLRQMGFKTFYDYWNEDYDSYSTKERLTRMIDIINHIADLPSTTLRQMLASMQDVLDHNHDLIVNQTFKRQVHMIS